MNATEQKHTATQGPWMYWHGKEEHAVSAGQQPDGSFPIVATVRGGNKEANARLIAAAPDLLHAADAAFEFLGGVDGASEIRDTLLSAIMKAEGRS